MTAPIAIAGGYGVVGAQIATLLRERHPQLPLLLGGRTPAHGVSLADRLGHAHAVTLDVDRPDPIAPLPERPAAIVAAVNDLDDHLLEAAIRHGVALVDITRWTDLVRHALAVLSARPARAPVLLSSGWMAGVVPLLAAWCAGPDGAASSVDVAIRYAMADRAGPDSFAYVDRFGERYEAVVDGERRRVPGLSDGRRATFADGSRCRVYRLDTPEQLTLPLTLGARTATTRIGFDSAAATLGLVALRRAGVLRTLSRPRFTKIRNALLHQPGDGGVAQVRIDVVTAAGERRTVHVSDPDGQSHLTAAGAVVGVERLLDLDGAGPEPAGPRFPEQHPDLEHAVGTLRACGVDVRAG